MATWKLNNEKADIPLMSKTLGISPFLCQMLVNRGIRTKNSAIKFLNPVPKFFNDANKLLGIDESIWKIMGFKHKKIVIYGDYDVDGVMSTTILYKGLAPFFDHISYYIPNRETEGYGLNNTAVQNLHEQGTDLILACDNGVAAPEEVALAKALGMDVIIIDHHQPIIKENKEVLPPTVIINPKQAQCQYPFKEICAAGLCYKFICLLHKELGVPHNKALFEQLLIFAAIATMCDVVDLINENRVFVRQGLQLLKESVPNHGILALVKEKNISDINEDAIGFTIGPCINAAGRLDSASLAVELFTTECKERAKVLAKELVSLNEQRKHLTKTAVEHVETLLRPDDNVLVIYCEEIHESVAGIVAGRIKDKAYKPTIVITKGETMAKGSARSVEGYDIYNGLAQYRHLFERFGGHEMAAGLSMDAKNIDALRQGLNQNFCGELEEIITIDSILELDMATYTLAKEIDILRPFGKKNTPPLFMTQNVPISALRCIKDKDTLIFTFLTESERPIKGICFGETERFSNLIYNNYEHYHAEKILAGVLRTANLFLDIVYHLEINQYNGIISVQLRLKDFRVCKNAL